MMLPRAWMQRLTLLDRKQLAVVLVFFLGALTYRSIIAYLRFVQVGAFIGDWDDVLYYKTAVFLSQHSYVDMFTQTTDLLYFYSMGYPVALSLVFRIAGASESVAVAANILLGATTVCVTYMLAREMFQTDLAGISAACFLLVLPAAIYGNVMILADTLFLFLALLASLFYFRALRSGRGSDLLLLFLSSALCVFVRNEAILILAVFLVHAVCFERKDLICLARRRETALGAIMFIFMMIPQLLFNAIYHGGPFVTGYAYWLGRSSPPPTWPDGIQPPFDLQQGIELMPQTFAYNLSHIFSAQFLSPLLIFWVVVGFYSLAGHTARKTIVFSLLWVTMLMSLYSLFLAGVAPGGAGPNDRYALPAGFPLLLLGGEGIAWIGTREYGKIRRQKRLSIALFAYVLAMLATTIPQAYLCFNHLSNALPYFEWAWFMGGTDSSRWLGMDVGHSLDLASIMIGALVYPIFAVVTAVILASETRNGPVKKDAHASPISRKEHIS